MTPPSEQNPLREGGFSLLETLVALAIFALALGQVAAAIRSDAPRVAAAAAELAGLVEAAGRNARLDGEARMLRVAEGKVTVFRGAATERAHQVAAGLRLTAPRVIRLDANGGSTGGVILLASDDRTYAIQVSRFDGSARIERRVHARR